MGPAALVAGATSAACDTRACSSKLIAIDVATDGSVPTIEQARTLLESVNAYPVVNAPLTTSDIIKRDNSKQSDEGHLATVVIFLLIVLDMVFKPGA